MRSWAHQGQMVSGRSPASRFPGCDAFLVPRAVAPLGLPKVLGICPPSNTAHVLVLIQLCWPLVALGTRRSRCARDPHSYARASLPLPKVPIVTPSWPGLQGKSPSVPFSPMETGPRSPSSGLSAQHPTLTKHMESSFFFSGSHRSLWRILCSSWVVTVHEWHPFHRLHSALSLVYLGSCGRMMPMWPATSTEELS